ncbi:hypothetical protein AB0G04_06530 [Actinoplanes sp. NPDC023801]|uniref:hypothetical protein n=1 Tax=Actinoplanes sp. NPDC023801 TaxID=3154595 RepID=UPI00340A2F46
MREEHPIDRLVVALEGEAPESLVTAMRESAIQLAGRRSWVLGPPQFIDQSDEYGTRWFGFGLSLYTALPPWGAEIDPQVDRAHLEEVKELLTEVCGISEKSGASFQVEYAGELNGMVESGEMDSGLKETLIGEWERALDAADRST